MLFGAPWAVEVAFKSAMEWFFATDPHFPQSRLSLSSGCSRFSLQILPKVQLYHYYQHFPGTRNHTTSSAGHVIL